MAGSPATLLARVRTANSVLESLASGQDRKQKFLRATAKAEDLQTAVVRLQVAHEATVELNEEANANIPIPKLASPTLEGTSPLEWFDSGTGIEYIDHIQQAADRLYESASDRWVALKAGLQPGLLEGAMIERLRGNTEPLDAACDELEAATTAWRSLPEMVPSAGDVQRARDAKAKVEDAWEALGRAGATPERIEFLKRVGNGAAPLTTLSDDLLRWLRETGLVASLVVSSR